LYKPRHAAQAERSGTGIKKSVPVKAFWLSDAVVIPKFVTIITPVDAQGRVNAVPYSPGTTHNVGKKIRRS
jgi:hypothetical protein